MTAAVQRLGWQGEEAPPDWIIRDFAARGCVTIIAGEAGAGKSILMNGLEVGVLRQGQRVVAVDAENGRAVVKRRLAPYRLTSAEQARMRVYIADSFNIEKDIKKLRQLAQGADLLVLDSWVSLWHGSELSVRQVKACLEPLRDLAHDFNCAVVLIHHTTKSGVSYRGSGAIAGTVEMLFTLTKEIDPKTKEDTGVRRIHCTKMRIEEEPKDRFITLEGGKVSGLDGPTDMSWALLYPMTGPMAWARNRG